MDTGQGSSVPSQSDRVPLLSSNSSESLPNMTVALQKPSYFIQYFATFCATLGAFAMGTVLGYSSPAGAILTSNSTHSSIHLTNSQNSWFSSIANLGALMGGIAGGVAINKIGRRGTMLFSSLPMLFGWALVVGGQNFIMLLFGRIFTGFSAGLISIAVPTYIAEFASPEIRGGLAGCFQLMIVSGVLFAFCLGAVSESFRIIGAACAVTPIVFVLLIYFSKESPIYLLYSRNEEKALESLKYFRGKDNPNVLTELRMLKDSLEKSRERKVTLKDLKLSYIRKPLLMSLGLFFFQQFSGINAVLFNLESIFAEAETSFSQNTSSIVVGATQVLATLVGIMFVDKAGRKLLLAISASVMALSLFFLGAFFYLKHAAPDKAEMISWAPLFSLVLFIIAFSIGYGPIPWIMMGELFSPEIKETASSVAASTNWFLAFVTTLIFFPLEKALTDYDVYWIFGAFCIVSVFYVIFGVFETKGKSLQEINAHFAAQASQHINRSDCI